jgi:hypothetical protein
MKKILVCACVITSLGLASCDLFGPPLEITVSYAPVQYEGIADNEFPVWFPATADIALLVPDAEIASHGPTRGGICGDFGGGRDRGDF